MPSGTIDATTDYVKGLVTAHGRTWPTIAQAQSDADEVRRLLSENLRQHTSEDVDIVVFGSLARREWTSGSDVDWTMLIDGQADPEHRRVSRRVLDALAGLEYKGTSLKPPGTEGIFGNMAFSHDIIHHIGGQADTNRNTTQRILMLLEAASLREHGEVGPLVRVVRQILNRYLESDSNLREEEQGESRIPRFLLNDIVRYWRTMCVDFAYKDWEQAGKKWALRNAKLRMSRKLLFFAGLLTVFSCDANDSLRRSEERSREEYQLALQTHLEQFARSTPLNVLVWSLQAVGLGADCCEIFDIYEEFLKKIDDRGVRDHLGSLTAETAYADSEFTNCRELSHRLQALLNRVCFDRKSGLQEFICKYGVF